MNDGSGFVISPGLCTLLPRVRVSVSGCRVEGLLFGVKGTGMTV